MSQAEKWKAAWKFYLGIATIMCAGSVMGMFYLSSLLLHMAVKASAVWQEFQLHTLPDSWQRRDMHAATAQHWDDVTQKHNCYMR